ncbi:penicillin-binding protein 1C [candidate division KSB1 bacterium]|nr:penicillin-binding protein 1C [candidate division KSB1 bacterium]
MFIACYPVSADRLNNSRLQSLQILDRREVLLREVLSDAQGRGIWISLDEISEKMRATTITVEDKCFYYHFGIDPIAIVRALWMNILNARVVSGGSTITQQLARQMYHLPHRWYCKPLQALLAIRLEIYLSKREILEQYLNRVPYGNQLFGVEAASRTYLDKPSCDLSLSEAAFLAGLPQSPTRYNPYVYPERARRRYQQILRLLYRKKMLTGEEYDRVATTFPLLAPGAEKFGAPHFCQMIIAQIENLTIPDDRQIATTLDGNLQTKIEKLAKNYIEKLAKNNVSNAAVFVLENATNSVRAWIGSVNFFDDEHQGQVDGVLALRQPGSAIKPFTYGLALESGYTPASILSDIETHAATAGGDFSVHNYDDKFHGPVRLRTALACSYNVATVRLLESLGTDLLLEKLKLAGLVSLTRPASYYGLGLTLGNGEVTLRDLTNAYAALSRKGELLPIGFLEQSKFGDVNRTGGRGTRIFPPHVSFLLSDILSDPLARAPAFGLGGPLRLPFACAAKTGTTKDYRDNWTIGFTTEYTVGVWVGNFDNQPMEKISGITGAAPLFRDIMLILHEKKDPSGFKPPANLQRRSVCSASGFLPTPHCPGVIQEWFVAGTMPTEKCRVHQTIAIDRRDGSPANCDTPRSFVTVEKFEIWPPEYHPWMESVGLPIPPQNLSSIEHNPDPVLAILFPDDGDIFKIDPILRREYQTITLEAMVPSGLMKIDWTLDDSLLVRCSAPFRVKWMLQPGDHTLQLRAVKSNKVIVSEKVNFSVF